MCKRDGRQRTYESGRRSYAKEKVLVLPHKNFFVKAADSVEHASLNNQRATADEVGITRSFDIVTKAFSRETRLFYFGYFALKFHGCST